MKKLDEVCTLITDGTHYSPKSEESGFPFVTVKDMAESGLDFDNCIRISEDVWQKADDGNSAPRRGDVLLSKDGTVGKVHVVKNEGKFAALSSIAILRPDPEVLNSDYLGHFLRSEEAMRQASRMKTGTALRRIILKDIKRIQLRIPSIYEQRRIAAILDKTNEIYKNCRKAYATRELIARSSFLEMFGDVRVNNHNYPMMKLGDFCEIVNGSTPKSKVESYWGGNIPWVSPVTLSKLREPWLREPTGFITIEGYESCSTTMVDEGSILFSSRAPIGLVAIASMPVCTNQGFKTLTGFSEHATPEYMYQLMREFGVLIAAQGRGATFAEISKSIMAAITVPVPPLEKQKRFSSVFKAIYTNREMSYQSFQEGIQMQASLNQEIF